MRSCYSYGMSDLASIAAGAVVRGSGGGYRDAQAILQELDDGATNFYTPAVSQTTTSASQAAGVLHPSNSQNPALSSETHTLYAGRGFSNASDDLAVYCDATTGQSTGRAVRVIQVAAAPQLYATPGVLASFANVLHRMGYAGALPPGK